MKTLSLGYSPCPNDAFIFHALTHGLVEVPGVRFESRLEDVETLNRLAREGGLDVTKVSYGVVPYLLDRYVLLRSGGALGRGCGPLLVARDASAVRTLSREPIAIPGRFTTANLLFRLYAPDAPPGIEMTYDRIMPAVAAGEVPAGLIIHESRFTYPEHGLSQLVDLGEWWEGVTGAPIPLGAIVASRALGDLIPAIDRGIRASVEHAFANPSDSTDYVARHAQELSPAVRQSHIDLYVNRHSIDLGDDGEHAVRDLLARAQQAGLLPETGVDLFGVR